MKATKQNNLVTLLPQLAAEWHPEKNGKLKASHVMPDSPRDVWWLCKKGHTWYGKVIQRRDGLNCPVCYHNPVGPDNNIEVFFPDLTEQWHPIRNGKLYPFHTPPFWSFGVWWQCENGHEWKASIVLRSKNHDCPYCEDKGELSLRSFNPLLSKQFHPTKNGYYTPDNIRYNSTMFFWWRCNNGHEWRSRISVRKDNDKWCPYCNGSKLTPENSLAITHPELAAQWHPTKNLPLTPTTMTASCSKKLWWQCEAGHEWQAPMPLRLKGSNCPYCCGRYPSKELNLKTLRPDMAAQWHPTKNGDLKPEDILPGSPHVIHWICEKGHEWSVAAVHRTRSGCPTCGLEKAKMKRGVISLETARPDLAAEWHPKKNKTLTPKDVSFGSNLKVWWLCDLGHSYQASVKKRNIGTACPYCAGHYPSKENNLAVVCPDLAKQWDPIKNGNLKPRNVTPSSHQKVWWLCEHGHSWQSIVQNRKEGNGCPICHGKARKSGKSGKR